MRLKLFCCFIGMLALLGGCNAPALDNLSNIGKASDPTRFYTLTSTMQPMQEPVPHSTAVIGVGPVVMADYLDRSQIVVRESRNQLMLAEFDRWAGAPAKEIQRVLGENLSALLGTERVIAHPWKASIEPHWTVELQVEKLEYGEGKVWLSANWQVFTDHGREVVAFHRSQLSAESGKGYDAISAGLSQLLAELSSQIAAAIG